MIRLGNVEKVYEQGVAKTWVLRRVSVDIKPGRVRVDHGSVGGGASRRWLHILGMYGTAPSRGSTSSREKQPVHAAEAQTALEPAAAVHRIRLSGLPPLLDDLTVYENLDLPSRTGTWKGAERKSLVCDTLDRFQIVGRRTCTRTSSRWAAAARGGGARDHRQAEGDPGRRGPRAPTFGAGPRDHGALQAAQRGRRDDRAGHALGDQCRYGNRIVRLKDGWMVDGERAPDAGRRGVLAEGHGVGLGDGRPVRAEERRG